MRWSTGFATCVVVIAGLTASTGGMAQKPDEMMTPQDLLKDPKFKSAYMTSLGPKSKERWLAGLSNSALVRKVGFAGDTYLVATPCKPHDCGDNNLMLLYSPAKVAVFGKLYEKGRTTLIGSPDTAMSAELEKMWKKEFRQQ
jgi:hypothetical protein